MLTPTQFERFAEACSGIANEVADDDGFVSVRSLLARFQADLSIRPLLVEAMLAFLDKQTAHQGSNRWTVLVDSETFPISKDEIQEERYPKPLPSRLRNTIAHELVHSLAFRFSEFGIHLQTQHDNEKTRIALVEEIEKETERLSPLLLWSEKALAKLLSNQPRSLSVHDLDAVCQNLGISRYVLINRLRLLRSIDPRKLLVSDGLRNTAIGIGEWRDTKRAVLRSWPLFVNFDRSHIPAFFIQLAQQDRMPASVAFADESFAMCGGTNSVTVFSTNAGTEAAPNAEQINIECSIGDHERTAGKGFLYAVRKLDSQDSVV
jgi:hypothetical protein